MSVSDFTSFNPFAGESVSDTANRIAQGLALASAIDPRELDDDAARGLELMIIALQKTAVQLAWELHDSNTPPVEAIRNLALGELAKRLQCGDPEAVEVDNNLKVIAERMNCTTEKAADCALEHGLKAD